MQAWLGALPTPFPLFNGGTLEYMLIFLPYKTSTYQEVLEGLTKGWEKEPLHDKTPEGSGLARRFLLKTSLTS